MNAGGDPGRDDYGLPRVDIEVPDDARELARDVQAYHRELRAQRRRTLARRVYGPLARDGMVLPLLAGCLALTLLAATLLTVFTARQATVSLRTPHPAAGTRPAARSSGVALLNTIVFSAGQAETLGSLPGPVLVLALVPPQCRCLPDLRELTVEASVAGVYLVGVRGAQVDSLVRPLGLAPAHAVEDSANALPERYHKVALLTAVLVRRDGTGLQVVYDHGQGFGPQIGDRVRALIPPGMASLGPASPNPATPPAGGSPAG